LSEIPESELKRIKPEFISKYRVGKSVDNIEV
jgi:hypothetical protein